MKAREWRVSRALAGAVLLVALALGCGKSEEPEQQAAPATRGPDIAEQITTETGVEMVLIPAGEFIMGDEGGEDDEKPAHRVRLSALYMDKHEVTQRHYEGLMGRNPSKRKEPDSPVEQISWRAAVKYCNMRSLREGLEVSYDPDTLECDFSANGYRLPTEAEWEYACRAGTKTDYSFGNDPANLRRYGWFKDNSGKTTHPVGQRQPNPWGLHDMHGNVAEWCNDSYDETAYQQAESENPRGPAPGEERVLRGGSWLGTAEACRSSARYSEPPGLADVCFGYDAYGFRCVRQTTPNTSE